MSRIHLIACGGAIMHNLMLALFENGHQVSGSDDEIFEPAYSRLKTKRLLPEKFGWEENRIHTNLDFIILGMHARKDNPELLKAQSLGIKIYSFPEYIYEHSKAKIRIVIAGSHGKTSTTAMLMHSLHTLGMNIDYLVGSQLEGFDTMVRLSDAPVMVIEGDEYLTSAIDPVPKFLKYYPHITQITGIAWDHINVFPTFEMYLQQFEMYIQGLHKDAYLTYFSGDPHLTQLVKKAVCETEPYSGFTSKNVGGVTQIEYENRSYIMSFFGEHNFQNLAGAMNLAKRLGINPHDFLMSMQSFKGAGKRLELIKETADLTIFRDFAHSPSKLSATVKAVREQFPNHRLMAVYELHTFSSLNSDFLPHYKNCLEGVDISVVYVGEHVFELKKIPVLENEVILNGFSTPLAVVRHKNELFSKISEFTGNESKIPRVLLLMSSGNFDGLEVGQL